MRKTAVVSGVFLLAAILIGVLFYQKVYLPKATFESVHTEKGDFSVWIKGIGELDAQLIYDLGFPVTGRVMHLYADQGDVVEAKQLLAQLDESEVKANLAEVQALHTKTLLEISSTHREIAFNQEQYDLDKLTYARYQKMLKGGNISLEQFDQAKSAMLRSKISLETAKIKLALSKSEATRVSQSIEVVNAKIHNTQLHTPVAGLVVERLVERGQSVAAAQKVMKVVDPKTLWIRSYIDERISGKLAVGQKAKIILRSLPNKTFLGTVKRIDFQSDPVTQEHVVFVDFDEPLKNFYLNEQAEVSILVETLSDVNILPITTLATYQTKSGVWVSRDSEAIFVPIKLLSANDLTFAFEGDLSTDDIVLMMQAGKKPLFDGVNVKTAVKRD
jgi:RND family efflux transporter MFP subunit